MNKKILIGIFGIIALVVLLSGCAQQAQCGNGTCDSGETAQICPADCESTSDIPMPQNPEGGNPPALPF